MEEQWIKESKDSEPRKIRPDDLLPPPQINKDFALFDWVSFCLTYIADMENGLGVRKTWNQEKVAFLLEKKDFQKRIERIRKDIGIDDLEPISDIKEYFVEVEDDKEIMISDSYFLWSNEEKKGKIADEISSIRKEYNLSPNFIEWLQYYILYAKVPEWVPEYNLSLLKNVMENPEEVILIPLNKQEKVYLRARLRKVLGIGPKGKPPRKYGKIFQALENLLSKSVGKERTSHTLIETLRILESKKENEQSYLEASVAFLNKKDEEIEQENPGDIVMSGDERKLAQNLRKRKQRLNRKYRN